jgi:hypothetical protein
MAEARITVSGRFEAIQDELKGEKGSGRAKQDYIHLAKGETEGLL